MAAVRFLDKDGTFTLDRAENYSYLYLPVANEKGLKAAVTPDFGGDSKVDHYFQPHRHCPDNHS